MTANPWVALLVVTSLPYRFLQALFLDQLLEVGAEASHYGHLLGSTANLIVLTIVLAFWGRAVYARACRLTTMTGSAPGREAWRVPMPALASYILTGSAALLLGFMTLFTVLGFIAALMFAGMAIGTMELNERVSLRKPFALAFHYARPLRVLVALVFVFFCAIFVAFANLIAAFELGGWLAGAVGGFDAPGWRELFSFGNRRFVLALFAGAVVAVEPFWIASHVLFVRKAGAAESGDDLRTWLEELRRAS